MMVAATNTLARREIKAVAMSIAAAMSYWLPYIVQLLTLDIVLSSPLHPREVAFGRNSLSQVLEQQVGLANCKSSSPSRASSPRKA